jgi:hypothetical protein
MVLLALARELPGVVLDANFYPGHGAALLQVSERPIEVFCRCPAAEVERRFSVRASTRHPGHVDHVLDPRLKATLNGLGPLNLGGPVLEVDTTHPVDPIPITTWITSQPEWKMARRGDHSPEVGPEPW